MSKVGKTFCYIFLVCSLIISLFPFYFMFTAATNSNAEILRNPPSIVFGSNLMNNFSSLSEKVNIWRVVGNSTFVAVIYSALTLLLFSMAGYAFAKFDFRGKKIIFGFIMICLMLPQQVLYVPLFKMMTTWGLADTYTALLLPPLANAFGIFLMRQNILAFPDTILEAARIDGTGEFFLFFRIVLPNLKSSLSALGIYMFLSSWNSFMWPLIILGEKNMYTLPVALQFLDALPNKKDYGMMMLAAAISVLPIMIVYLVLQKQFVSGVMGGAVKE